MNRSSEVISISEFKSKSGVEGAEEQGFIRYMHLGSEETGTFTGKNLSEAREKLKAERAILVANRSELVF